MRKACQNLKIKRGYEMIKYYETYSWKGGKPIGTNLVNPLEVEKCYKIVADPYYKHLSIEKYSKNRFERVVYDSQLLDFRKLTLRDQIAWHRETLSEGEDLSICMIRNQDDRVILIETLIFEKNRCRRCTVSSVHGIELCYHKMYYKDLDDELDGVVLYDIEGRVVLIKNYEIDPITGDFSNLISENWENQANT